MENVTTLTPFHEEPYGKVRSWKAYGNGILAWKEGELYAYTVDGRKSLLVASAREDAQVIGRDWSYEPYSHGAIFYEWSRRRGHEGMDIDKRIEITAYPDNGKWTKLYDTGDQYILPPLEWTACSSGIVVAKEEESWKASDKDKHPDKKEKDRERKNKEKTFILYNIDGSKKPLYRGWCDEWKPYGQGIIIRQGNDYLACAAERGNEGPKKIKEVEDVECWAGYGRGLVLGQGNEIWAFHDGYNDYYSKQIFQGEWKKRAQSHLPALPCFQPCLEGLVMEQESELILLRDYAAKEVLYANTWKHWEVYDNLLVIEQLQQEEKKTIQCWSAVKIKDSTSLFLAGIEKALQHKEISRTNG